MVRLADMGFCGRRSVHSESVAISNTIVSPLIQSRSTFIRTTTTSPNEFPFNSTNYCDGTGSYHCKKAAWSVSAIVYSPQSRPLNN